ncbi:hypothetical protein K438DRAFT_1956835 [Mycena galopus ATCC 62051]|nr:hypothetical protein K438DRAFT_1956835 [Mycena galopus ATCC 62051]
MPSAADEGQDNWEPSEDASRRSAEPSNEPFPTDDHGQAPNDAVDYPRDSSVGTAGTRASITGKSRSTNKVYIGGLPEHTRQRIRKAALIGNINMTLEIGYGFVDDGTSAATLAPKD